jgi:site-specific DNA-methyltransferase (adenine-specific)
VSTLDLFSPAVVPDLSIVQADSIEWLQSLAPESVDLAITDPAYESLEKHRAVGTTTRLKVSDASSNEWFPIFRNDRFPALFAALYRAMKKDSHLYLLCDQETMFVVKPMGEAAGFKFWKPLVWDKKRIGMGYHYRARCEFILFFEKGKRRLADLGTPDVLAFDRVHGGYPTEKPVDMLRVLVGQSSAPGELVVDPFTGSGSTAEAAGSMGRKFAGCDVKASAVDLALARAHRALEKSKGRTPA